MQESPAASMFLQKAKYSRGLPPLCDVLLGGGLGGSHSIILAYLIEDRVISAFVHGLFILIILFLLDLKFATF